MIVPSYANVSNEYCFLNMDSTMCSTVDCIPFSPVKAPVGQIESC